MKIPYVVIASLSAAASTAGAQVCPKLPVDAVTREFPSGAVTHCTPENQHGLVEYVVQMTTPDHAVRDVTVSLDGRILQIVEPLAVDRVPIAVMKAFDAKHPAAQPTQVERVTTNQGVTYQITFTSGGQRATATFDDQGRLRR